MADASRPRQLPLGVALRDSAAFTNFWDAGTNRDVIAALHAQARTANHGSAYVWGPLSAGKTHLLQAACQEARANGLRAAYLPLAQWSELRPEVLDGWQELDLVCLDDVDRVAGESAWERALFVLFNELRDARANLAVTANASVRELGLALPDLASRLAWGGVYRLQPVPEAERLTVLQLRARGRGLELPAETGRYLLRKSRRDMASLCGLLDTLDIASLAAQRRLTIPFVREILAADDS